MLVIWSFKFGIFYFASKRALFSLFEYTFIKFRKRISVAERSVIIGRSFSILTAKIREKRKFGRIYNAVTADITYTIRKACVGKSVYKFRTIKIMLRFN